MVWWWARLGSNQRPTGEKAVALPAERRAHRRRNAAAREVSRRPSAPTRAGQPASDASGARRVGGCCARSRSEEHTSELQSLMRISYAVFCLKKKKKNKTTKITNTITQINTYQLQHKSHNKTPEDKSSRNNQED